MILFEILGYIYAAIHLIAAVALALLFIAGFIGWLLGENWP